MKNKSKVRFKCLEIYHFSRCLGIDKVPERGNNPLGMESNHFNCEKIDIARKKRCINRFTDADTNFLNFTKLCTSTPISPKTNSFRDHSEDDNESIHSVMSIDYTPKSLQPLNPIQRKKCLESAGVDVDLRPDDASRNPKILSKLREDRKQVGCKCSNLSKCDPSKCSCSSESIPCQSDGTKFPCKCGDKCSNAAGKRVYLFDKIRFHYRHTFNRNLYSDDNAVNIDVLSTLNGDCTTCSSISEDTWKTNSEAYHQTRSRKRAGDNNLENNNIPLFKPLLTVEDNFPIISNTSDTITTNGHANIPLANVADNQQPESICHGDHHNPLETVMVNCPIVLRTASPQFVPISSQSMEIVNKENIAFTPMIKIQQRLSNEKIVETTNPSPMRIPVFKTPFKVQSSNQSFLISPISSPISTGGSDAPVPCTYSTELDYHKSFLNKESFEECLLSPSVINLSPVKFNPISLASEIRNSLIDRLADKNKLLHAGNFPLEMNSPKSGDHRSPPITHKGRQSDWVTFCDLNSPSNDTESGNEMQPILENAKETDKSRQAQSESEGCPLSPSSNRKIIEPKSNYSFRLVKNAPHYLESPIVDYKKRKSWRARSMKSNKFPNCITASPPNQNIKPEITGGIKSFLMGEEIRFFDIPCAVKDEQVEDLRNERAEDC